MTEHLTVYLTVMTIEAGEIFRTRKAGLERLVLWIVIRMSAYFERLVQTTMANQFYPFYLFYQFNL